MGPMTHVAARPKPPERSRSGLSRETATILGMALVLALSIGCAGNSARRVTTPDAMAQSVDEALARAKGDLVPADDARRAATSRRMSRAERLYWAGAAIDMATTAGALALCENASEANPALTVLGEGAAEVVAVSALVNWALYKLLKKLPPGRGHSAAIGAGALRFLAAGNNFGVMSECLR